MSENTEEKPVAEVKSLRVFYIGHDFGEESRPAIIPGIRDEVQLLERLHARLCVFFFDRPESEDELPLDDGALVLSVLSMPAVPIVEEEMLGGLGVSVRVIPVLLSRTLRAAANFNRYGFVGYGVSDADL